MITRPQQFLDQAQVTAVVTTSVCWPGRCARVSPCVQTPEMSASVMRISDALIALASVITRESWCQTSVGATIIVIIVTTTMMDNMTQSPEKMKLIWTYYQEKCKLTTPASQNVTLLTSLICPASCVETNVCRTDAGVWRAGHSHAENTASAQTTSSSAPTPHSGLGRVVMTFMPTGEKQLWAGDAPAPYSTAATPGIHQAYTIMR